MAREEIWLRAAAYSDLGLRRKNNEDNLYFAGRVLPEQNIGTEEIWEDQWTDASAFFGVFDGMGGESDGETASFLAASCCQAVTFAEEKTEIASTLETLILQMNDLVAEVAENRQERCGTTGNLLYLTKDAYFDANVGDSRTYLYRQGILRQLSTDHTDAGLLARLGIEKRKPRLSQYIGLSPEEALIEPSLYQGEVKACDRFLLCSDGLTDLVSEKEIAEVLALADPGVSVQKLVSLALAAGGRDNITVLVVEVLEETEG